MNLTNLSRPLHAITLITFLKATLKAKFVLCQYMFFSVLGPKALNIF